MTKFTVSFSRKVQTKQYENMTVSLSEEFDSSDFPPDVAFSMVKRRVERWIKTELQGSSTKAK